MGPLPWSLLSRTYRQAGRWLVTTGSGYQLEPAMVVCAAGAANAGLLAAAGSARATAVRSRLEVMVAVPTNRPPVPALCLDYGGPTLVPTRAGALISLHGAPRVDVDGPTRLVPVARTSGILRAAAAAFPGLSPHVADAVAYSCVKTELVDEHADRWGSRPAAAVLDHSEELLPGLFTVVPGKMTLAFHATAKLAARILGAPVDLPLPPEGRADDLRRADGLVAVEPWRSLDDPITTGPYPSADGPADRRVSRHTAEAS